MRVLLQFPGQLSEHVGMTELPLRLRPEMAAWIELAEQRTGIAIGRLCAQGPEQALHEDRVAAVAMITANQIYLETLRAVAAPDILGVAGHSVGCTSALVAAGSLGFREALDVVLIIDEAIDRRLRSEGVDGAMGVIVGMTEPEVTELAASQDGACDVACVNARSQIAVSGLRPAVEGALAAASGRGAIAAQLMPMRKPMHSRLLAPLRSDLDTALAGIPMTDPQIPLLSHIDGRPVRTRDEARALLAIQLGSQVRWCEAVGALTRTAPGAPVCECGPGDVLTRLNRWIDRGLDARALSTESSFKSLKELAVAGS